MKIIPTILTNSYNDLKDQITKIEPIFDYAQLDIMDGKFVDNKSFNYNEKNSLEKFFNKEITSNIKFELHLMVNHPLKEIAKWKKTKNIFRVIFHIESDDDPMETIATIRKNGWKSGISLNPKTSVSKIKPYQKLLDMVLFMTVNPGKQGGDFIKETGEKIKKFKQTIPTDSLAIAIDGGVNEKNIKLIKSWGVDIANVGSALMEAKDINQALKKLQNKI